MNSFPSTFTPRFIKHYYELHIYLSLKELREEIYRRMLKLNWVYDFKPFFKKHDITSISLQNRMIVKIQKELKNLTWTMQKQKDHLYKIQPFRYSKKEYYYPYRDCTKPILKDFNYKISPKELESIELTSSFLV